MSQIQQAKSQPDYGLDSGVRIKEKNAKNFKKLPKSPHLTGLTIVKPIVFGNYARYFGKKREEDGHTHEWTVYVKPYLNEDMSTYVKKVHFKLHESYSNQNRVITKPPYEVTETGWGEFEIIMKIYFHDPNERPMTQSDSKIWFKDQVLIVGDSRVTRLKNQPNADLSVNVSYECRGGANIDELISMTDEALVDDHAVVVMMGLVGDEVAQFCHSTSDTSFANLIKFRNADSVTSILTKVQEATLKWQSLRADRVILWTTPYYIDFVAHNKYVLRDAYTKEIHEISLTSSKCYVEFIAKLTARWRSSLPTIYFTSLNRLLFEGRVGVRLFHSFGGEASFYKFPFNNLTDGLHPGSGLTSRLWKFLDIAVTREFNRTHSNIPIIADVPHRLEIHVDKSFRTQNYKSFKPQGTRYSPYIRNSSNIKHRIQDRRWANYTQNNTVHYGNLSWHAPSTSGSPVPSLQTEWTQADHEAAMTLARSKMVTKAAQADLEDSLEFARAVKKRAVAAVVAGEIPVVNQAAAGWAHNKMLLMDRPDPRVPSFYPELSGLVISSPFTHKTP